MRIQQNTDVQINPFPNQNNAESTAGAAKTAHKSGNMSSVSGANLKGKSLVQQRQGLARKQALKVVSDAFGGEKKLDAQMQSIKDEIKRLQDEINEKTANTMENDAKLKELQEEYGIDPDGEESKELSKLAFKMNNSKDGLSDEEISKMSEYQQKALYYVAANQQNSLDIDRAKAQQMGNVQGYADMKRERAKSQDMLKAQDEAEDIMETAGEEAIALLTQEAVEHVDEEQKEREEEAKEAAEKKKEEKKEEAKKLEKEAMQQEMIENIKEHAAESNRTSADTKRAIARRERAEADSMGAEEAQRTIISEGASMEDTQNAVNTEITNILNKLSLLSSDVKGSTVDSQI
ncbi:hypothetical protein SAMN02745247_00799 [Butyrivibrio hungatei DSM 14810]|uniref:Uncharacterized protein n=1 Tax=Butyrivibrio hungatei DSM 14810 TaxID=1121132 RepID=A0A1M7S2G1_9FIRM|nr:hypothetical protein [Butyrivibrio hungatei]SHN52648.1 hypothetical protein SAMN02745247_00799 [Butyrivibrio hungatei DSM 14810]